MLTEKGRRIVYRFPDELPFALGQYIFSLEPPEQLAYSDRGRALVLLDRGSYWQCGFSVPKGVAEAMQAKGIEEFRADLVLSELRDWPGGEAVGKPRSQGVCEPALEP